jgi:secreted protein with Ig-like and vWFA domain
MAAPTTLTITFAGGSGSPQTITLPKPSTGVPMDYTLFVRNAFLSGGFWYVSSGGANTFVPWGQVTAITAQ